MFDLLEQVCGLKWSPDGRFLASGGNDNMLNIWNTSGGQMYSNPQPLYTFRSVHLTTSCQSVDT